MAISPPDLMNSKNEFNQVLGQQKGSALDKDSFMLLLVTQFKYQDPLNPMEDKEFIAQLAQFSSLEQLMNLNDSMGLLTDATNNQQMINATSYIGKSVMAYGTSISKQGTAISKYEYALDEDAATGTISIFDSKNSTNLVYTETLTARKAGKFTFEWDGKTLAGAEAADGVYVVRMAFQNAQGAPVIHDSQVSGEVSGVVTENGTIYLKLADERVLSLANVRQVTSIKPTPPPKPEEPGDGSGDGSGGAGDGSGGDTGDGDAGGGDTVGSAVDDLLRAAKKEGQQFGEELRQKAQEEGQKLLDTIHEKFPPRQ